MGRNACAFVELKEGSNLTAEALIAFCRNILPGFKTPRSIYFGPLPKTSTGKIQKFELRERMRSSSAIDDQN
ncbi:hypothetical protein CAter10_2574 [Collimonas arenae]|nr:hypothetical protein CAter10_2574 [Collimonas arenae]